MNNEILDSIENQIYSPVYEKENMQSRIDRERNYIQLCLKWSNSSRKVAMLGAIKLHLNALRLPSKSLIEKFYVDKSHATEALQSNVLDITPEFAFYYDVIDPTKYIASNNKKYANYEARQLCKELVREGVLYPLKTPKTKDRYLVNPLYIYYYKDSSCKFGTVYLQWATCNNITIEPNDPYLKGVYNKNKLSNNRAVRVDDPITAEYKQSQESKRINKQTKEFTQANKEVTEAISSTKAVQEYQVRTQPEMIEGPQHLKDKMNKKIDRTQLPEDHPDFCPF